MSSPVFERGLCPRNPAGGGSEGAVEAPFDWGCRVDDGLAIVVELPT